MFRYTISGTAARGQTWEVTGPVEIMPGGFCSAVLVTLREMYMQLNKGDAVFGKPGLGCDGPYAITKYLLELDEPCEPS
jgi:hypothetical protein